MQHFNWYFSIDYVLKSVFLAILCAVLAFTAFACPWYVASNPSSIYIFGVILLGALAAIIYTVNLLRKALIKDTGNLQALFFACVGILFGIIVAIIKWKIDLARYFQARGTQEVYGADIAELLMSIAFFCVLGFIGGLFIGLIRNKR